MLESEAKTKWCPKAMVLAEGRIPQVEGVAAIGGGYNRRAIEGWKTPGLPSDSCCIGSACMMWEPWPTNYVARTEAEAIRLGDDGWMVHVDQENLPKGSVRLRHDPHGDCGLKAKECNCHE